MDQEVEAILNAPDSDDEDGLNVQGVSLEDILREDDGGSNEDEEDQLLLDDAPGDNPPHLLERYAECAVSFLERRLPPAKPAGKRR